jgi:hypothetical protein
MIFGSTINIVWFLQAVEINPDDSTLYAKRSLCSLHAGDKSKALDDANIYKDMQPELSKSRSEQAAALILVKVSCVET